jgi:hypothetical protein
MSNVNLRAIETVFLLLTAANAMNKSSSPKRFRLVFIESFTVKRAINVHTTTASKIHETTFKMVPGSAIGAVRRR